MRGPETPVDVDGFSAGFGSSGAHAPLRREPQTAITDKAAALPLVIAERFEFGSELGHGERLMVVPPAPGLVCSNIVAFGLAWSLGVAG